MAIIMTKQRKISLPNYISFNKAREMARLNSLIIAGETSAKHQKRMVTFNNGEIKQDNTLVAMSPRG